MSTRLDFFYSDGSHGHGVYSDGTAEAIFRTVRDDLRKGKVMWPKSRYLGDEQTTLVTIVKGHVDEEPWY